MGFFSRNKNNSDQKQADDNLSNNQPPKLPDLPALPMPSFSRSEEKFSESYPSSLPSIPNSAIGNRISQESVKEAVIDQGIIPEIKSKKLPSNQEIFIKKNSPRIKEMSQKNMGEMQRSMSVQDLNLSENMPDLSNPRYQFSHDQSDFSMNRMVRERSSEPLYIKLDKFENALSTFNEIKLKVSEIDSLLRNIREIKMREEKELNEWEREIETIKAKLENIDRDLFKSL